MQQDYKALKKNLWEKCVEMQKQRTEISRQAMLQAQESANDEKGTMGDKFESFREQMQIDRDMYAKQYDESSQILQSLMKIDPEKTLHTVALGALVITDSQHFFISASIGQITLVDKTFVAISSKSPMFISMAGKKKDDLFSFRDKKFKILEVV